MSLFAEGEKLLIEGVSATNTYSGYETPLNPVYFATPEAAEKLRDAFGAAAVVEEDTGMRGNQSPHLPGSTDRPVLRNLLYFPGSPLKDGSGKTYTSSVGFTVNSGWLADRFMRDGGQPDPVFETMAHRECWAILEQLAKG
jgi:hypothetical protein